MYYVGEKAIYLDENNPYNYKTDDFLEIKLSFIPKKYYAVRKGVTQCICFDWDTCKSLVSGFSNAEYKSFHSLKDAIAYMERKDYEEMYWEEESKKVNIEHPEYYAYVDGSYNDSKKLYGYGVVLVNGDKTYEFLGNGSEPDMLSMRNASGEILGAQRAIQEAINLNLPEITIYFDHFGIKYWATEEWQRTKTGTKAYHAFIQSVKDKIKINFVKVKAHSGVELNERVDKLAKQSVGIE